MLKLYTTLDITAIILALTHFGIPLTYYWYMKTKYLNKPWNIKTNPNHKPKITIIIPTYNEAHIIEKKLDNIYEQNYPKDKLEVIIVDSASTDETPEKVLRWASKHSDISVVLMQEPTRRGMAHALYIGLNKAKGDIVIVTDADAIWKELSTLEEVAKWLSSKEIGAVSCIKIPYTDKGLENTYRRHYNILRIAESKKWSTPIFHGELSAFKKKLLDKIGGFPLNVGSAESLAAMKIVALGYRAIIPDTIVVNELIPLKEYIMWRIRRAQHLILHLIKSCQYIKHYNKFFKEIILIETYLHIVNPWLFLIGTIMLFYAFLVLQSILALITLVSGLTLFLVTQYRTWILHQIFLIIAQFRNLWRKELIWAKQRKTTMTTS